MLLLPLPAAAEAGHVLEVPMSHVVDSLSSIYSAPPSAQHGGYRYASESAAERTRGPLDSREARGREVESCC